MQNMGTAKIMLCIMGVVMFVLGVITLILPKIALTTLALMLGGGFVITGIFCLLASFAEKEFNLNPAWVFIHGVLNIFIGIFLLWNIGAAVVTVPYIIAFWMMFSGISKFAAAFNLKVIGYERWWLGLINGVLGIMIAFVMLFFPFFGSAVLMAMAGIYLIFYGILVFAESFSIKTPAGLKDALK